MYKTGGLLLVLLFPLAGSLAQSPTQVTFYNQGATLAIQSGAVVSVSGGLTIDGAGAQLLNQGNLFITNGTTDGSLFLTNTSVTTSDGLISLEQDFVQDATFNASAGEVEFSGNNEQLITSNVHPLITFNDLTLSGTGTGINAVKRLVNVDIILGPAGVLNLNDRELATGVQEVSVLNPALNAVTNVTSGSVSGMVSSDGIASPGRLFRVMSAGNDYLFPVGSSQGTARYSPVHINSAGNSIYGIRLANYNATTDGRDVTLSNGGVCEINAAFYHEIRRDSGTSGADIRISYNLAQEGAWDGMAHWSEPVNGFWNNMHADLVDIASAQGFVQVNDHQLFSNEAFVLARQDIDAPEIVTPDGICADAILTVTVKDADSLLTYQWNVNGGVIVSGQGNDSVHTSWPAGGGTIFLTALSPTGCSSPTVSDSIQTYPKPVAGFTYTSGGQLGAVYSFTDTSLFASQWLWIFPGDDTIAEQHPVYKLSAGQNLVTLIASSGPGCSDTATAVIGVAEAYTVPNVFTPNGDGMNDEFYIPNTGFDTFRLSIYNRWGNKVWETESAAVRWDGRTPSGIELPAGVYYYVIEATTSLTGSPVGQASGTVTLMR